MAKKTLIIGRSNVAANRSRMGADRRRRNDAKHPMTIAVSVRRQTLEEERRFNAALKLFLTELVRQQLGRQGGT